LFAFKNFINLKEGVKGYSFQQWEDLKNTYIKHVLLNGGNL
jgi:hypothetical protein